MFVVNDPGWSGPPPHPAVHRAVRGHLRPVAAEGVPGVWTSGVQRHHQDQGHHKV